MLPIPTSINEKIKSSTEKHDAWIAMENPRMLLSVDASSMEIYPERKGRCEKKYQEF